MTNMYQENDNIILWNGHTDTPPARSKLYQLRYAIRQWVSLETCDYGQIKVHGVQVSKAYGLATHDRWLAEVSIKRVYDKEIMQCHELLAVD